MAEFLALCSLLIALFLFALEWDEEHDGRELSNLSRLYLGRALTEIREESNDYRHGLSDLWKKLHGRRSAADKPTIHAKEGLDVSSSSYLEEDGRPQNSDSRVSDEASGMGLPTLQSKEGEDDL